MHHIKSQAHECASYKAQWHSDEQQLSVNICWDTHLKVQPDTAGGRCCLVWRVREQHAGPIYTNNLRVREGCGALNNVYFQKNPLRGIKGAG